MEMTPSFFSFPWQAAVVSSLQLALTFTWKAFVSGSRDAFPFWIISSSAGILHSNSNLLRQMEGSRLGCEVYQAPFIASSPTRLFFGSGAAAHPDDAASYLNWLFPLLQLKMQLWIASLCLQSSRSSSSCLMWSEKLCSLCNGSNLECCLRELQFNEWQSLQSHSAAILSLTSLYIQS